MSAGSNQSMLMVNRDLDRLAPQFAHAVRAAIADCNAGSEGGLRAMVYEGWRSPELQSLYYQRGRTVIPPHSPVTYAPSNLHSWHGFGLAVDVVHREKFWNPPGGVNWFRRVAEVFRRHGCTWGGDWKKSDPPHFQWGRCPPSPSDAARALLTDGGGLVAVWDLLEASDGTALAGATSAVKV
ncbi:MAG: M15 family metallopeptidase [Aquincola tertiaricarbonis]